MEAATLPEPASAKPRRSPAQAASDNILWILLAAALAYYLASDFYQTLDDVKTGLSNGMIWALIALGYTMVYGIIELINFAHGEIFMVGSFVCWWLLTTLGFSGAITDPLVLIPVLILTFVVSMGVMGVVGVVIERL